MIGGPHGDTASPAALRRQYGVSQHGRRRVRGKDVEGSSRWYAARYVAKNLVAVDVCDEVLVQLAYAIGVDEPLGCMFAVGTSRAGTDGTRREDPAVVPDLPYDIEHFQASTHL